VSERRKGRRLALQLLFGMEWMKGRDLNRAMEDSFILFAEENIEPGENVIAFARERIEGVERHRGEIDDIIRKYARNWRLERMSAIDRNILRIAVFEIRFCPSVPGKVAINEAIEIAKEFGGEEAPSFINGILDRIFNMEESASP
jgi:N utilization substance protein B